MSQKKERKKQRFLEDKTLNENRTKGLCESRVTAFFFRFQAQSEIDTRKVAEKKERKREKESLQCNG